MNRLPFPVLYLSFIFLLSYRILHTHTHTHKHQHRNKLKPAPLPVQQNMSQATAATTTTATHQKEVLTNHDLLAEIVAFLPTAKDCQHTLLVNHLWRKALVR
jgi:hypothetical protein